MTVLVTGAHGYIGSTFINYYRHKYTVITFSLREDTIQNCNLSAVECLIHCAALVHQKKEISFELYSEVNVKYSLDLALKAKDAGVRHFIFLSSVSVYGESLETVKESTCTHPETPYGKSKLEAEKKLLELEDEHFVVSILRIPMVYGKNAPGNIASLMFLIDKMPLLPFGVIHNRRSFAYVGNVCALMDTLLAQRKSGVFLASDDETLSTTTLIELIARAKHKKIVLLHVKLFERLLQWFKPAMYQRLFGSLIVDNTQTKERLNFKNPYSAEDGIRRMVQGDAQ